MLILRCARRGSYLHKINFMAKKFFNIIPSNGDTACLLLYGPVGEREKIDAGVIVSELMALEREYSKIDIRINSVGGEVFAGIAIFNALASSKADITIYVDGVAASIAGVIALCGKPLYMSNHARLMLHCVSGGEYGNASQLRQAALTMESIEKTLSGMIATRCKLTPEEVSARYFDGVDHWISASEALGMGLIDGIYDIDDDDAPSSAASSEEIYQFFTNRLAFGRSQSKDKNMAFINDLRARPSFTNATTEEQLMAEIARLENSAAKVPALEGEVARLKQALSDMRKAGHEAVVNQAVTEGRITEAQKTTFMALLASDEENAKTLLGSLPARNSSVEKFINRTGKETSDLLSMSWDEIDKAGRLAELKNKYPEAYKEKFAQEFGK